MSIITDGVYECCGNEVARYHEKKKIKQQPTPPRQRRKKVSRDTSLHRELMRKQGGKCFYCGVEFGSPYRYRGKEYIAEPQADHFLPFQYAYNNQQANFVLACQTCNKIKSSHVFDSKQEAKAYVLTVRAQKNR